jgi:hypothetical protein
MDAYVYLKQVTEDSLDKLVEMLGEDRTLSDEDREEGAIRAVGLLTGADDAVIFVEAARIEGIQRLVLQRIRKQAGVPLTETYLALDAPGECEKGPPCPPNPEQPPPQPGDPPPLECPDAPKRRAPLDFHSVIKVKAKHGLVREAFWDLFCKLPGNPIGPGLQGEARTTGYWDMLVEVGAYTPDKLSDFIERVKRNEYVADTEPAGMTLLGWS